MTDLQTERLRLIKIVSSGIHKLSAVAADVCLRDRIEKHGAKRVQEGDEFDALAAHIAAPYVKALAELAAIETAFEGRKNQKQSEARNDTTKPNRKTSADQHRAHHAGGTGRTSAP
jgi:hypothetical protein